MSEPTFEQLRLPAALILIIIVAFIFLPRPGDDEPTAATVAPDGVSSPSAGEPGGVVLVTPSPTPQVTPTPAPTRRPATPEPTPTPAADGRFAAEVLACRSIQGSSCNGRLGVLPGGAATFTALVRFSAASAGDAINVILVGPGGTIAGSPFTLQGGGDGYYYSIFTVAGLPTGEYTVTAMRNGAEVAQTSFRRGR